MRDLDDSAAAAAFDLVDLWQRDRRNGVERPFADYLGRFPGHEERVARELLALQEAHAAAREPEPAPSARPIDRYRLVRELGRGGQGSVHLAEDTRLGRLVALKMLDGQALASPGRRERLRREADALARVDHPGICAIHDAQVDAETPFLAMRYVDGESLAARLRRAREQPDAASDALLASLPDTAPRIARVLACIEQVARALHAAHEAGLVHRDVKPQNIVLEHDDHPVLLDFGIARDETAATLALTRAHEVFGSIGYMAPEQIEGHRDLDRRCDVHALGVTMFECLTLERPYAGETTESILRQILAGTRRDASSLNRAIPRDVALVLDTALERERGRRYASALAFAEDLRRLREHRPIQARPSSLPLRVRRWCTRHPAASVAFAILAVALAVTTTLLLRLASQQRGLAAWQLAVESSERGATRPVEALRHLLGAAHEAPARNVNPTLIDALADSADALLFDDARLGSPPMYGPFFTPDDRFVVIPTNAGEIVVADAETGAVARRIAAHGPGHVVMAANADGTECASCGAADARVRRWRTSDWTELPLPAEIASYPQDGYPYAPTPLYDASGRRLAVFGIDGRLLVADLDGSDRVRRCAVGTGAVRGVRFASDGERLVCWSMERHDRGFWGADAIRIVALDGSATTAELDVGGQDVAWAAWDPAGTRVAVVGYDRHVRVFDAATGACVVALETAAEDFQHVHWVDFDASGERLITLGFEGVTVWDLQTRERKAHVAPPTARPFYIAAWNGDRTRLAGVVKDGTIRVLDTATWTEVACPRWYARYPESMVWNRAGTRLAFHDLSGLHVACTGVLPHAPRMRPHTDAVTSLAVTQDGRHALTASRDGTAAIVDLATGRACTRLSHPAAVRSAELSPDERTILTVCEDGKARIHGDSVRVLAPDGVRAARFCDGARRVLTIGHDGAVLRCDAATGTCETVLTAHAGACLSLAIDEEGALLATGGADRTVRVTDLRTGAFVRELPSFFQTYAPMLGVQGLPVELAFDRRHQRLVAANRSDAIVVWSLADWQRLSTNLAGTGISNALHVAVDPSGRWYASSHSGVGDWSYMDTATLETHSVDAAAMPDAVVSVLRFSPDGELLLVASHDGSLGLWDLARGERHSSVAGDGVAIRAAAFTRDGEWVVAGAQDGTVRAIPVHPLQVARAYWSRLTGTEPPR